MRRGVPVRALGARGARSASVARIRFFRFDARDPDPSYDAAKASPSAKAVAVKPANLVIVPAPLPATPEPEVDPLTGLPISSTKKRVVAPKAGLFDEDEEKEV